MFEDFTLRSRSGDVIVLKFTQIIDRQLSPDPNSGFYMADNLLTWGVLYAVGTMKHKLEDGRDENDIVLGLRSDIIYDFIRCLNKLFLEDSYSDWEFAIPSQGEWAKAYNQMRFGVEGDQRIYERTTDPEPRYSTRDSALMQEPRFCCESAPNKRYPYCDSCYNTETSQYNVGIRLVLKKRNKNLEGAIDIVGKMFEYVANNRNIHCAVKNFVKKIEGEKQ